jgi:hypothetical protein
MQVILANPRGFCAGVERAIAIVERAIDRFGAPIYVRHEVVHNQFVCDDLRAKGAIFVDQLSEVPTGSIVIFSAHGVSKAVKRTPNRVASRSSTPPARWSPRYTSKWPGCVARRQGDRHDRPQGTPRGRGNHGPEPDGMYLVETVSDARQIEVQTPDRLAYVTQTTLVGRRRRAGSSRPSRNAFRKSSARRRTTSATRRRTGRMPSSNWPGPAKWSRRRQPVEFQLEPAARSRRTDRQPRLSRRSGRADRPRLAQWRRPHRRHRRRVGTRSPRPGRRRSPVRRRPDQVVGRLDGAEENVTFALPRELQ